MNYRLDKSKKNKKFRLITIAIIALVLIIYFRTSVFGGLSRASLTVFGPVLVLGNNIGNNFKNFGAYFSSRKRLFNDNENLKTKIKEKEVAMSNYGILLDENNKLKEMLGRKNEADTLADNFVLSAILSKPNRSPYDTLLIDVGIDKGVDVGNVVFALGNIPIGRVDMIYPRSSKVALYSTPGEKTDVVVAGHDASMQLVGRGGGNFEMILPRDFIVEKGTEVHLPGITPYVVGIVETVISDPRDAFTKALLVSPVNIQELKFVEVRL